jgi:hypothetical protein
MIWPPGRKKEIAMNDGLKWWVVYSWIALPTVMYGGYALLGLVARNEDTEFRRTWFRAGHAHAGVLLLMSLLYEDFIAKTDILTLWKHVGCGLLILGIFAQSGGFFVHMTSGEHGKTSIGTTLTSVGALVLTLAILVLVYGIVMTA